MSKDHRCYGYIINRASRHRVSVLLVGGFFSPKMLWAVILAPCYTAKEIYLHFFHALRPCISLEVQKKYYSKMVWYFIGVSKINRTLHDRCTHSWNIFQLSNRNLSLRRHITSTIYSPLILDDQSVGQFNYWQWSVGNLILFPTLSSNSQFTWNFRTLTTYCIQKPFSLSASTSDEDVGAISNKWKYKYLK